MKLIRQTIKRFMHLAIAGSALTVAATSRHSSAAPIPTDFDKNAVQFIFTNVGTNDYRPFGTCFILDVPEVHYPYWYLNPLPNKSPVTQHYRYIVTARHVLFETNGVLHPQLYLRGAKKEGGVEYVLLNPWITNLFHVVTHTNPGVDLAALSIRPTPALMEAAAHVTKGGSFKLSSFDATIIMPDEKVLKKRHVREGDEMFFVGLFTPFYGINENIPICRFGRVSMLPAEPVPWGRDEPTKHYLMEAQCFGGNSGSPPFFYFPHKTHFEPFKKFGIRAKPELVLAGVVKGYWYDRFAQQNVGVTAVVPLSYLRDMLYSPDEKAYRKALFATAGLRHYYP